MAKVLNVEKLEAKLRVAIKDKITKGNILDEVGEFTRKRIYEFTKRGFSLAISDLPKQLKSLSDGYKKYRKRYQEWAKVGSFFSPNRSNLTLTGQMLDALTVKTERAKSQTQIIVADTSRTPTEKIPLRSWVEGRGQKKFKKSKPEPALTNAEVASRVADKGRPFLGLDQTGRNRVRLMVVQEIRRKLRESGFKK